MSTKAYQLLLSCFFTNLTLCILCSC